MAEKAHVKTNPQGMRGKDVFTWSAVTESDTFAPLNLGGVQTDILFIPSGTPGGSTLVLQGSHDGTNWVTILDAAGTAISLTVVGTPEYFAARDAFPFIRPSASGGTSQSWTVSVVVGKPF